MSTNTATSEIGIEISGPQEQSVGETRNRHLKLYRAALKGDWEAAEAIYSVRREEMTARITEDGDTALHIAASAKHSGFVENLVKDMGEDELAIRNADGNTAFFLAAATGNVELLRVMLAKNTDLPMIEGGNWMLPLQMAASLGHREAVLYLFRVTDFEQYYDYELTELLVAFIKTDFYDVARQLLDNHPELATARDSNAETALHVLARKRTVSSNFANQNRHGILKRCFNQCSELAVSDSNKFRQQKLHLQALELVKCLWKQVKDWNAYWISEVIFVAAREGNIEFLTIIIRDYPELILKVNEENYSMFHVAVLNRQKDIFKLIYEISPSSKNLILQYKDNKENNILHLAGKLAPSHRLNTISGVALQLQQELLWFDEVSKIVHPSVAEAENNDRKTPRALFTETHAELKDKGEKWMKETANSCMIVATLIATVVFAAAFTVPGGTQEDTGTHFVRQVSFIIFVMSDAASLVSSVCSILTFLSILTSRYTEEDFCSVLPGKLVVGLSTLFLSIAAMMVVFCATIFIVYKDGMIWVPVLVSAIASFPVILFTKHQWRLLSDVAHSTFKGSSLFQSGEHTLFYDEGKETKRKKDLGSDTRCYDRVRNCWY